MSSGEVTTEVRLRDGSRICIRPLARGDESLIASIYDRLGEASRRRRFLTAPPTLREEDLMHLTDVDHRRHDAVVALDAAGGEPVGEARWVRTRGDSDSAEVAAMVVDDWQGRGVATALLDELTARARAAGLRRYTAIVSTDNAPVLAALERQGARHVAVDSDEVELVIGFPDEGFPDRLRSALRWAAERRLRLLDGLVSRLVPWSER